MNDQQTDINERPNAADPNQLPQETGAETQPEKRVPVSEAIRYRKRAQAAEKELNEVKESHEKQTDELTALKEQVQALQQAVEQHAQQAAETTVSQMTQGVKETRTGGARTTLQTAARQAAESGSRADVQEYLRLRRNFM